MVPKCPCPVGWTSGFQLALRSASTLLFVVISVVLLCILTCLLLIVSRGDHLLDVRLDWVHGFDPSELFHGVTLYAASAPSPHYEGSDNDHDEEDCSSDTSHHSSRQSAALAGPIWTFHRCWDKTDVYGLLEDVP